MPASRSLNNFLCTSTLTATDSKNLTFILSMLFSLFPLLVFHTVTLLCIKKKNDATPAGTDTVPPNTNIVTENTQMMTTMVKAEMEAALKAKQEREEEETKRHKEVGEEQQKEKNVIGKDNEPEKKVTSNEVKAGITSEIALAIGDGVTGDIIQPIVQSVYIPGAVSLPPDAIVSTYPVVKTK